MTPSLADYLDFAIEMAHAAAVPILSHFNHCTPDFKPDGSEVTIADKEAEALIRGMIARRYPDHDILGEEFGDSGAHANRPRWIIDPIDGTTSFTWGVQAFGTLIGLVIENEPVVGVIHMPALRETVYAAAGLGCWFRTGVESPTRARVSRCVGLRDALVSACGVNVTDIGPEPNAPRYRLSAVLRRAKKVRFAGDCLQHALVCRGRIHAAIDTVMQPWDIAALIPCIQEAGGIATSMTGSRSDIIFGGSLLTSADASLHDELIECLKPLP